MPHQHLHPERITERTVRGFRDDGQEEVVSIWLEYVAGGLFRVCRVVDLERRDLAEARTSERVFDGYELDDALRAANQAIEAELDASTGEEDRNAEVRPITRTDVEPFLERILTR
jgi:hypothetical protein